MSPSETVLGARHLLSRRRIEWRCWYQFTSFYCDIIVENSEGQGFGDISKRLIIKGLDNQTQVSKYVCLIVKSLDTQVQKLHNQINQYPKKAWYVTLTIKPFDNQVTLDIWVIIKSFDYFVYKTFTHKPNKPD